MKKLSAEEKLAKLVDMFPHVIEIKRVSACPYGDLTHVTSSSDPSRVVSCLTCSSLDGSECVDELLEAYALCAEGDYDGHGGFRCSAGDWRHLRLAIDGVRAWRKAKR